MPERDETDTPDSDSSILRDKIEEQNEKIRSANLTEIDYEKCQMIKKAGDVFRKSEANTPGEAVGETAEQLNVSDKEAEELLKLYTLIFTQLGEHSTRALMVGIMYLYWN